MGGNALSEKSIRLSAERYNRLANVVMGKLKEAMPCHQISVIPSYASKPDFGDLDVLIEGGEGYDPLAAAEALGAVEVVQIRNSSVTSVGIMVDFGMFQVDLIEVPAVAFNFALNYFSFNDLGNLLMRVAQKAGFKLAHSGLFHVLRDQAQSGQVIAEILVTQNWDEALTFLGYNPDVYQVGKESLATLQDVFAYAVSSPYAHRDIYLLQNQNHKTRTRLKKRQTHIKFIDWLENIPAESLPQFDWSNKGLIRETFLREAMDVFPVFMESYNTAIDDHRVRQAFQARFNGNLVAGITGLSGRELGEAIRRVKATFPAERELVSWVMSASNDEIAERIVSSNRPEPVFEVAP